MAGKKLDKNLEGGDQRIIFDIFAQILKGYLYIKLMFQFCRLHFLHNASVKKTLIKLHFKDSDLFGHQIKNTRRAKLLHLKYFKGLFNFYLFCKINFNFSKMSIFYGFLNKLLKKIRNQFISPQSLRF